MIIETIWFKKVDDVKPVCSARSCVLDPEVVPLGVPSGAIVWLQDKIILEFIDLNCSSQVAAFKSGFKYQGIVISRFWNVIRCKIGIVI
jgi:hypothetical protein